MGRLRKRKQSVTHEGEDALVKGGFVGNFMNTRTRGSRWFKSPDSWPGERPSAAHNVSHAPRPLAAVLQVASPFNVNPKGHPCPSSCATYLAVFHGLPFTLL